MSYKNPLVFIISLFLFLSLFTVLFCTNLAVDSEQQFVLLAESFLKGQLNFINIADDISDTAYFMGNYYWPLGPFPAVFLMPFVFIFKYFLQGFISFPLSLLNFWLLYKIARIHKIDIQKSLLLATFFIFGSIYTPLAALPASWYFSQTLAVTLIITAIYEFLGNRRFFLIGMLLAAAVATRFNLIFAVIFFIPYLFKESFLKNLFKFSIPIIISVVLLATYNFARFQNPTESGYNLQLIPEEPKLRRDQGLFSPKHIPSNLYFMIFKGPDPVLNEESHSLKAPFITFDSYGLSIFFLSPILFLIFRADYKDKLNKMAALTILVLLVPILTYYGIGQKQVGFRYALDFYPFLYLLLLDPVKKTNRKILYLLVLFGVIFSVLFTFYYLGGLYINK